MWVRHLRDCPVLQAGDGTALRELLHPHRPEAGEIPVGFSLAHARLAPGGCSRPHRLLQSSEVYYILEGRGIMHVENQQYNVEPGHAVYIPPGALQWIENIGSGDLGFLALVDPPWRQEDEKIPG
ncbi:MAG: cupin domain-containing protein [Deltaproteobacteria bacterium]|nr:cupin domain-containing protein [Deltaproteobacteria bacterium]MBW2306345.1 cupin domain-containing protein [Deltaproteobacteria bacterium]